MPIPANATDRKIPVAFRLEKSQIMLLKAIGQREGHVDLTDTLRRAAAEYIESHLYRREKIA